MVKSYQYSNQFNYKGEKLTKEEAKSLMKELCEPEDDEGFMPFMRESLAKTKQSLCSNYLFNYI